MIVTEKFYSGGLGGFIGFLQIWGAVLGLFAGAGAPEAGLALIFLALLPLLVTLAFDLLWFVIRHPTKALFNLGRRAASATKAWFHRKDTRMKEWWNRKKIASNFETLEQVEIKPVVSEWRLPINLKSPKRLLGIFKRIVAEHFRPLVSTEKLELVGRYFSDLPLFGSSLIVVYLYRRKTTVNLRGVDRERWIYSGHVLSMRPDGPHIVDVDYLLSVGSEELSKVVDPTAHVLAVTQRMFPDLSDVVEVPVIAVADPVQDSVVAFRRIGNATKSVVSE